MLVGRGSELERDLPFGMWVAALDDHVAALGADRVEALVGDRAAELARVLPSAAGSRDVALGGLQDERFRAHRAVRALLVGLAVRRPVVLLLDDIHWADDASLELIVHLLRRPAPARILIALAFREGQLPASVLAALEASARESSVGELRLAPLSADEADAAHGRGRAARPSARRSTARAAATRSTCRSWPAVAAGGAAPFGDAVVGVPATVSAALGQEIEGLGDGAQRLVWGAAVAGDPADLDLAAAAAGLGEQEALAALEELVERDVLRADLGAAALRVPPSDRAPRRL